MAISMTGFGRGEYKDDNYQFLVECKTINHKYADINIRLPRKLSFLEDKARILVKDYIKRGRVDLYIKLDLLGSEDVNLKFDEALATQYVSILKQIKDKFDLVDDISVMNIAKFPDVIKTEEKEDDEDKLWSMLKVALENALLKLKEILLSVFPENLKLKDLGKLVVIPTFYVGNEYNSWKAIFYNNLPNSETEDYRVVDVAMASSAAPVFFPSYDCHIDGGIIATDPSLASIIYSIDEELGKRMDQIRLLSFGTGYCYNSIKEDTSKWGAIDWVISKDPDLPIISVTLEGNAQLSQIFSKKLLDSNYYRVNPKMDKDISMDDTKSMDYLLELAAEYNIKDCINWINNKWNKI